MAVMSWALVVHDEPDIPVLLAIFEQRQEAVEFVEGLGCREADGGKCYVGADGRILSIRLAKIHQEIDLEEPGLFGDSSLSEKSPFSGRVHLPGRLS